MTPAGAVLLAGGASRRMGASKALLPWGQETLLAHLIATVRPCVDVVVVSAAVGQELPKIPGDVHVIPDSDPAQGPLQGFCDALSWLRERAPDVSRVFLSGCDAPLLTSAVVQRVLGLLSDNEAAMPVVDGQRYPLTGAYQIETLPVAQQLLSGGERRLLSFVEQLNMRPISAAELCEVDPHLESLQTCNTPQEYRQALERAGLSGG